MMPPYAAILSSKPLPSTISSTQVHVQIDSGHSNSATRQIKIGLYFCSH